MAFALLARGDHTHEITGLSPGAVSPPLEGAMPDPGARRRSGNAADALGDRETGHPLNFACIAGCLHETLMAIISTPYLGVAAVYVTSRRRTPMAPVHDQAPSRHGH
ncbi:MULTISPECIES: hypothetical protein [Rhodomicrobium]|uniref:hypothetical protein n=1 Tax=Rhodomicrobium TaxID=1068 RepID=UPI00148329D7|nr:MULTISPECIES: hypothetical protein [Rhodomicrobium]